jgi:hypothetical protein
MLDITHPRPHLKTKPIRRPIGRRKSQPCYSEGHHDESVPSGFVRDLLGAFITLQRGDPQGSAWDCEETAEGVGSQRATELTLCYFGRGFHLSSNQNRSCTGTFTAEDSFRVSATEGV